MLKREQAEKQLEELRKDDWVEFRLKKLAKLPAKLRTGGQLAMRRDASGAEYDYKTWDEYQKKRAAAFKGLSDRDRRALFAALFDGLADAVERAWQLHDRLPSSSGAYEQRPFRTPNDAAAIDEARLQWLGQLAQAVQGYPMDAEWLAAWAPHLTYSPDEIGILLAGVIDAGGPAAEKVLQVLYDSAAGRHDVGSMGQHVTTALLVCSRPDAWAFMEKLLLAAKREEGLRQNILESIDTAHPQAFRRMLRVIRENDLARFSATVRALDTWFGFQWDAASVGKANEIIDAALALLDDPKARDKALKGDDPEAAYLAMWSIAFDDAAEAIAPAVRLLKHKKPEFRWVAARTLVDLQTPAARQALLPALDDADLRIAATAIDAFKHVGDDDLKPLRDLFDRAKRLLERAPGKPTKYPPPVWPWTKIALEKKEVADVLASANGDAPASRLIPFLPVMETYSKCRVIGEIAKAKKWDAETRKTLFSLAGDASGNVREEALKGLAKCKLTAGEAEGLEELLSRKAGDLRRGVLSLLAGQADAAALASADRLLDAGDGSCREAGLELLRNLRKANRAVDETRERAEAYRDGRKKLSKVEQQHVDHLLSEAGPSVTLADGLGLMDPAKRTPPPPVKKKPAKLVTPAALAALKSLDELIHEHREDSFVPQSRDDDEDEAEGEAADDAPAKAKKEEPPVLLGECRWRFPSPSVSVPIEKELPRLPLRPLWEQWLKDRPKNARDADGLDLVRALWIASIDEDYLGDSDTPKWLRQLAEQFTGGLKTPKLKYDNVVRDVLRWLVRMHAPKNAPDLVLDLFETALASIPPDKVAEHEKGDDDSDPDEGDDGPAGVEPYWRSWRSFLHSIESEAGSMHGLLSAVWTAAHDRRIYQLKRWWDEPPVDTGGVHIQRDNADLDCLLAAYKLGAANDHDVVDQLLAPRRHYGRSELSNLSARKPPKELAELPKVRALAERCRDRVIEVELSRGDTPTPASKIATAIAYAGGLDVLGRVLEALGKTPLVRHGWSTQYGTKALNKATVFSNLILATQPGDADTREAFAAAMKKAGVAEDRMIELALYAPRWSEHVEGALGWKGFHEATWWILGHTRGADMGGGEEEDDQRWKGQIGRYTPLKVEDLKEGAVDVAWFRRAYEALGKARWDRVYAAAKYACGAGGHKRAQLFADAMLGREKRADMITRVKSKRQQDAARALGLLPLASGDAGRKDLLERYRVIAEFLRTSRQFGSQRQASEKRAANIGFDNLARTAGYPDPIRLQWAMEALESADLAKGPVTVAVGEVKVSLSIDADGVPQVAVVKNGKTLASIPPAVKKNPKVAELTARKTDLRRSGSRMRKSLELAMCRGDTFTGAELRELNGNPMLAPMLQRVVFVGEGILGYPVDGGQGLRDHAGKIEPVKKNETLRLAHPHDLLATKRWTEWQHDCFARELVQPFKQVFRELYVLTAGERKEGNISRRYAGHQLQPKKTVALLTGRGWVMAPEEGAYRTFHEHQLTGYLTFLEPFYTPADIEGLTLEGVRFVRRGEGKPMRLADVPPRLFSEVMRDVDLVVSVAHRGGVDPEASASTVEMRSQLVRETSQLLGLRNVRLKDDRALINGSLGEYSVHLGSGVVHRMPGGALFIVPVHSQHRGRLFLPFADDDPRTAEVVSKVLLLARDQEIRDPQLLDQIRAVSS
jgi:hypothetical protein